METIYQQVGSFIGLDSDKDYNAESLRAIAVDAVTKSKQFRDMWLYIREQAFAAARADYDHCIITCSKDNSYSVVGCVRYVIGGRMLVEDITEEKFLRILSVITYYMEQLGFSVEREYECIYVYWKKT